MFKIIPFIIIYKLQWAKLRKSTYTLDIRLKSLYQIVIFNFEIKESLGLPGSTICYIGGISIPRTWYTVGTYNNQLYIETTNSNFITSASVITLLNGNSITQHQA